MKREGSIHLHIIKGEVHMLALSHTFCNKGALAFERDILRQLLPS